MTLRTQRPAFNESAAARLAEQLYDLTGRLEALPSERDQNYRIVTDTGESWVLKISGTAEVAGHLEFQNEALSWLAEHDAKLPVPRLRAAVDGQAMPAIDAAGDERHHVRLLSYLPGVVLAEVVPHEPDLLRDVGRQLAAMDTALAGFSHEGARRPGFVWDLSRAPDVIREHLDALDDPVRRLLVEAVLEQWEAVVAPTLPSLRRSVLYNDANDHNVLVSEAVSEPRHVTGFVDFGDMIEGPLVCDPAIAAAYAMLGKASPISAAGELIKPGFTSGKISAPRRFL